jgi:hypothetical protein
MSEPKADGIDIQPAARVDAVETGKTIDTTHTEHAGHVPHGHSHGHGHGHIDELDVVPIEEEAVSNAVHINLSWRSWLVVFITCFAYATFAPKI